MNRQSFLKNSAMINYKKNKNDDLYKSYGAINLMYHTPFTYYFHSLPGHFMGSHDLSLTLIFKRDSHSRTDSKRDSKRDACTSCGNIFNFFGPVYEILSGQLRSLYF